MSNTNGNINNAGMRIHLGATGAGVLSIIIAGQSGWLHGALTGNGADFLNDKTLTFIFNYDDVLHDNMRSSMPQTYLPVFALYTAGGVLVNALVARRRRNLLAA